MRDPEHPARNEDETQVRGDIEDHLNLGVRGISCALRVRDGHCPVLAEWTTDHCVVSDLNHQISKHAPARKKVDGELEIGKLSAKEEKKG